MNVKENKFINGSLRKFSFQWVSSKFFRSTFECWKYNKKNFVKILNATKKKKNFVK